MTMRVLALGGLLAVTAIGAAAHQASPPPRQVEKPFKPGGSVAFDLSAGAYVIRGGSDDVIRVRWETPDRDESRVQAEVVTQGARATIRTRGPKNNFRVSIDVPRRSDLDLSLSAGDLSVRGIEGNKSLSMWAGDVTLEVGNPEMYRHVEASVRIGELALQPFSRNTGGLLRSFTWDGTGKYTVRAKLFVGDLKLVR